MTRRKNPEPFYTIKRTDIGRKTITAFGRRWPTEDFIGRIMAIDIGKRVYRRGDILQVENDQQRDRRLATNPAPRASRLTKYKVEKRAGKALKKHLAAGPEVLPRNWTDAQIRVNEKGKVQIAINPSRLKRRNGTSYGTSHFVSEAAAVRYYRDYEGSTAAAKTAVARKLREGQIHIGRPATKPGQRVSIIDAGTRYAIHE